MLFITEQLRDRVRDRTDLVSALAIWMQEAAASDQSAPQLRTRTLQLAAERSIHVGVEACADVANDVIDALVMREPGGYDDIFRVLVEESVLSTEWLAAFLPVVSYRHRLLREYDLVAAEETLAVMFQAGPLLAQFCHFVRSYLAPVS